jgi:sugar lactone lactonase YvrE
MRDRTLRALTERIRAACLRSALNRVEAGIAPLCVIPHLRPWISSPYGMAFSDDGKLYVADRHGRKLVVINFPQMIAELGNKSA